MERFHLLRPDYMSRVTARFPETIDPATLLHDPHDSGREVAAQLAEPARDGRREIGRASCRERVLDHV